MTRERLGTPRVVGELILTPVERISLERRGTGAAPLFFASKRPVAILVRRGERAWRIELPAPGEP